jgi:hypothetical protein
MTSFKRPGASPRIDRQRLASARRWAGALAILSFFSLGVKLDSGGLSSPVNMYAIDSLLLVSDEQSGIHIYSVADRANPRLKMTIPVRGNSGCAVKGNVVYANSYGSILALRIHDDTLYDVAAVMDAAPRYDDYFYPDMYGGWGCGPIVGCASSPVASGDASSSGGTGGSYAVFAVIGDYLYYVNGQEIVTMDIAVPDAPREVSRTGLTWSIETIFPTRDYLFVGGSTGMYILDRSNPSSPQLIGSVEHFRSCDPVVVQDTIAYVTLRSGNTCGQNRDELMAVSIADPDNPRVLQEKGVMPPYGLSVSDSLLYVGFGGNGFALYDVRNPADMTQIAAWSDTYGKDFIWIDSTLYVMGSSEVTVYDASVPAAPVKVATIQ